MNKLRTATVFLAVVSLLFFIASNWFEMPISPEVEEAAKLVAAVLVALGILTNTGAQPEKLSAESILEKLRSPVAVTSIFALIAFVMYQYMAVEEADAILKTMDTFIVAIFGFSVYNNPNSRESLR